jgi:hypothetical protein
LQKYVFQENIKRNTNALHNNSGRWAGITRPILQMGNIAKKV